MCLTVLQILIVYIASSSVETKSAFPNRSNAIRKAIVRTEVTKSVVVSETIKYYEYIN